jgi:hypothetical protein
VRVPAENKRDKRASHRRAITLFTSFFNLMCRQDMCLISCQHSHVSARHAWWEQGIEEYGQERDLGPHVIMSERSKECHIVFCNRFADSRATCREGSVQLRINKKNTCREGGTAAHKGKKGNKRKKKRSRVAKARYSCA